MLSPEISNVAFTGSASTWSRIRVQVTVDQLRVEGVDDARLTLGDRLGSEGLGQLVDREHHIDVLMVELDRLDEHCFGLIDGAVYVFIGEHRHDGRCRDRSVLRLESEKARLDDGPGRGSVDAGADLGVDSSRAAIGENHSTR